MMPLDLINMKKKSEFCFNYVDVRLKPTKNLRLVSAQNLVEGQLHLTGGCKQRATDAAQGKSTEVKSLLAAAPLQDKDPTRGLQIPSRLPNASRRLTCK